MVEVNLHGKLSTLFYPKWNLNVITIKEALFAINVNTKGKFVDVIRQGQYDFFVDDYHITSDDIKGGILDGGVGNAVIDIVPNASGSGAGFIVPFVISALINFAVSLLFGPDTDGSAGSGADDAYLFSSGPRTAKQGYPVPVGYGTAMIYPIVIGAEYDYGNGGEGYGNNNNAFMDNLGGFFNLVSRSVIAAAEANRGMGAFQGINSGLWVEDGVWASFSGTNEGFTGVTDAGQDNAYINENLKSQIEYQEVLVQIIVGGTGNSSHKLGFSAGNALGSYPGAPALGTVSNLTGPATVSSNYVYPTGAAGTIKFTVTIGLVAFSTATFKAESLGAGKTADYPRITITVI